MSTSTASASDPDGPGLGSDNWRVSVVMRARDFGAARSPGRLGSRAVLVVLVAASTGLRAWAAWEAGGPWISPDEMIYSLVTNVVLKLV